MFLFKNPTYVWFKRWGWIYRPIHFIGWLITGITGLLCLLIFLVIYQRVNSVLEAVIDFLPLGFLVITTWAWIVSHTTKKV